MTVAMTQLLETMGRQGMGIVELQKLLPKKLSHVKEEAKLQFILACLKAYRENLNFHEVDFERSLFDGQSWQIQFSVIPQRMPVSGLVEQIMSKWYFSNLSKNENVYFYRFINVFRVNMSSSEWNETVAHLSGHRDLALRENILVYQNYREKLDAIDTMLLAKKLESKALTQNRGLEPTR